MCIESANAWSRSHFSIEHGNGGHVRDVHDMDVCIEFVLFMEHAKTLKEVLADRFV